MDAIGDVPAYAHSYVSDVEAAWRRVRGGGDEGAVGRVESEVRKAQGKEIAAALRS